jgi:hypothetical protein
MLKNSGRKLFWKEDKMETEILKKVSYRMLPLVVLLFFIPAIIQGQTKGASSRPTDELLGKWAGIWVHPSPQYGGQGFLLEIKEVNPDKKTVLIEYSWSAVRDLEAGKGKAEAKFIPPDKFEWYSKGQVFYEFQLKEGELWGTKTPPKGRTQSIVLKRKK